MSQFQKILVCILDADIYGEYENRRDLMWAILSYIDSNTEEFFWLANYLNDETDGVKVLFAEDDLTGFLRELEAVREQQKRKILSTLRETEGLDLKRAVEKALTVRNFNELCADSDFKAMCSLFNLAADITGEYRCGSAFYNMHDGVAFLYPDAIEAVRASPEDWVLVVVGRAAD